MRIVHVCYSDRNGGAARAAQRLHQAQRKQGIDSHMLVIDKRSDDPFIHTISGLHKLRIKFANFISRQILRLQKDKNLVLHSLNFFPSGLLPALNKLKPDVVNLHWLGGEMLSIGEIKKIHQPIVWTLHDMWAFSGCEHYDNLEASNRYASGYNSVCKGNRGIDLNRWNFNRKKMLWKNKNFHIVAPSHWLANCVKESALFSNLRVDVIGNCIDHSQYKPINKFFCREVLGLPLNKKLLLFGAMSSTSDPRKGYSLLVSALKEYSKNNNPNEIELVVFGASQGNTEETTGFKTHYIGNLYDDISLVLLYNAADLLVAPSLQDNLPNTLVESLACGTPSLSFNIGGMVDLIRNEQLGNICENIDSVSLATSINKSLRKEYNTNYIHEHSLNIRGQEKIVSSYMKIYKFITDEGIS
uniref:Glycosyltransferase n=1 Tax=Providencia stuartii TaxID=588 RepID=A0AAI9DDY1_PROST|nr:glycosyltransferase [Providencia stuartii]